MMKIMKYKWAKNKDKLREAIIADADFGHFKYIDLVRLAFTVIYNSSDSSAGPDVNTAAITEIDNGDYQGTLLYLIPFKAYQPDETMYLMTYVGYGSCCGCDTLLNIQDCLDGEEQITDYMALCKDIIANTIKPYNYGWRNSSCFEPAEETDNGEEVCLQPLW